MINTLSLLFSLGGVVFIIARAAMLDKTIPWFTTPVPPDSTKDPGMLTGRNTGVSRYSRVADRRQP
ncbi:MAG: hypothetical protein EOO38_21575 [Cytophagaceae bacterium]|nr:MAG: hypothetical protein EOO38_21575 [Cytophagaceae bacterium]